MSKIQPASAKYVNELRARWEERKVLLFERDGTDPNPKLSCGGHDIKNNPVLQRTLDSIVENCYVQLCARKEELCEAQNDATLILHDRHSGTHDKETAEIQLADILDKIRDIDTLLLVKNHEAFNMFLKDGSGLEKEIQRMESLGQTMGEEEIKKLAYSLVGATIKTLVNCCREHLHGNAQILGFIPGKPVGSAGLGT